MVENKKIEIDSFNPYESRFPNRKLVSYDTLNLIKYMRAGGYEVIVKPVNDIPVEYLFKKGVKEFLSDPINLTIVNIQLSIVTGLIVNYIQKLIDKNKKEKRERPIIVNNINITIKNSKHIYNYKGIKRVGGKHKEYEKGNIEISKAFKKCFEIKSPYPKYPIPIFLEHKPKIVGWCMLWEEDNIGIKTEGIIDDKVTRRRIEQNRLNGASVTGIATKTRCSICNSSYVECNHISGQKYNNKECFNSIVKCDFVEVSLVKEPINSQCLVGWKYTQNNNLEV